MRVSPRATYRLQLTSEFSFDGAAQMIDHLAELGISHLNLSPFLTARPGSTDFRDVTDHNEVSPVLGGEQGLRRLAEVAQAAGLGLIGTIIPGHMAIGPWNAMWETMLRDGRSSDAARYFDVDFQTPLPGAQEKVILPVLDGPYGEELEAARMGLLQTASGVRVTYGELSFPLNVESAGAVERAGVNRLIGVAGDTRSWTRMHSLLEQQHYRLVSQTAGRRLVNYRRHLHHNHLAALRVDEETVFDASHTKVIQLVTEGLLDGLLVDDVQDLADPTAYLERLRDRVGPQTWIVVGTTRSASDPVPQEWPIDGTAGHEWLRVSLGLQVDPQGLAQLRRLADQQGGVADPQRTWAVKQQRMDRDLGPDLRRLVRVMWDASQDDINVRDIDYRTLLDAVSRVLTALAVTRTYTDPQTGATREPDREHIRAAVAVAGQDTTRGQMPPVVWQWLTGLLTGECRWTAAVAEAVTRFQQLSAQVMVLGMEEGLRCHHDALVADSDLGEDASDLPLSIPQALERIIHLPDRGMHTTTSHVICFGEDLRMRLAALSGLAPGWTMMAQRILTRGEPPEGPVALRVLQVATALWPISDDGSGPLAQVLADPDLTERLSGYADGVTRGRRAALDGPDDRSQVRLQAWVRGLLDPGGDVAQEIRPVALRAGEIAMVSSLSATLLRITITGVPDISQGAERWDHWLGHPAERSAVDVEPAHSALAQWHVTPPQPRELWSARRDGQVKQWVLWRALQALADLPGALGPDGGMEPLGVRGRWSDHLIALRRFDAHDNQIVVVCPRLLGRVTDGGRFPPLGRIWADTEIDLPDGVTWHNLLTGHTVEARPGSSDTGTAVAVAELFADLPVALLIAADEAPPTMTDTRSS
ncbi:MAG: malto-oligosyltrehalose synthase [Euzebya sp.]